MDMDIDIEKCREIFGADRFAANAGIRIDAACEDEVVCSMEIRDMHLNAGNAVQGGAIFTLSDFAFGVHSNLHRFFGAGVGLTVGQSCSISYLRSPKGGKLIARSTCLHKGRTISVYRVTVEDELGNRISEMHGNGFTTRAQL
ncbi:MAG: PaaI family thioesterase [Clostridiales Family XIII bacterium]|jgi:acyl-CoA thioesterase|nr:PaaI family thioesterase [Clostridiales Family XIII bacterium]